LKGSKGLVLGGVKREQPMVTKEDDRGSSERMRGVSTRNVGEYLKKSTPGVG